jgi:hypothetical protein
MLSKPMKRSVSRAALTDEVARFQAEVQRLALAAAREIIKQEIDRRLAKPEPARQRAERPGRSDTAAVPAAGAHEQLLLPVVGNEQAASPPAVASEQAASSPAEGQEQAANPPAEARPQPTSSPTGSRKRVPWTRESIINELATWMLSGTAIDAPFVTRHGPPGLVAASRRVFGRFEAALNVAGLHVSKLYPDGPPGKAVGVPPPSR